MAVLKQTSPTAEPSAPRPVPQMTVPSARTRTPVTAGASQPEGAGEGARHFLGADVFLGGMDRAPQFSCHRFGSARTLFGRDVGVKFLHSSPSSPRRKSGSSFGRPQSEAG